MLIDAKIHRSPMARILKLVYNLYNFQHNNYYKRGDKGGKTNIY